MFAIISLVSFGFKIVAVLLPWSGDGGGCAEFSVIFHQVGVWASQFVVVKTSMLQGSVLDGVVTEHSLPRELAGVHVAAVSMGRQALSIRCIWDT